MVYFHFSTALFMKKRVPGACFGMGKEQFKLVFSSIEFIFRFLIVFLIAYYVTPGKYKNVTLLISSLIFYALGEPKYVILMMVSIVVNYFLAMVMDKSNRRKMWLVLAVTLNVSVLFVFKYLGFFVENINAIVGKDVFSIGEIALPIGISFYTFQIISYIVDVYRKKIPVEKRIIPLATYVSMFPQLIAGPIVNYDEVRKEMRKRKVRVKDIEAGCVAFVMGLFYKVFLANQMGTLWNNIQTAGVYGITTPVAWLGAWGYSFQLYFDFAGYSMMAIGLGRMMGFYLPMNFWNPYVSKTATEFWRRWHITLGRWFREYVYIPLGGNRVGKARMIFNLFVTWLLTGLWHGANWNFVIWGLIFFVILMIEKLVTYQCLNKSKFLGHIYMLILIPVTWMIFAITNIKDAMLYIARMFAVPLKGTIELNGAELFVKYFGDYWWLFAICTICATAIPMNFVDKFYNKFIVKLILVILFWICVHQMLISGENPFLYYRF